MKHLRTKFAIRTTAIAAVAALALAACGDDGDDVTSESSDEMSDEMSEEMSDHATDEMSEDEMMSEDDMSEDAMDEMSVSFASPEDGATVTSPFTVEMTALGLDVQPAADAVEGAGHFHIMIDTDCVTEGEAIPTDDSHKHFGDGSTSAELELEAGEHTLCLQYADNDHVATAYTATITVTVEA